MSEYSLQASVAGQPTKLLGEYNDVGPSLEAMNRLAVFLGILLKEEWTVEVHNHANVVGRIKKVVIPKAC
jgi:hypothetical protein